MSFKFDNKKVTTVALAVGVGALAIWFLKKQAGAVLNAVNPLNNNNVINQGAHSVVDGVAGNGALDSISDYAFGVIDLINPFNGDDTYAEKVTGQEDWWNIFTPPIVKGVDALGTVIDPGFWRGVDFDYVNPVSDKNVINQGYTKIVGGEKNASTIGDYFFGALDLINPFNKDDAYAKKVYGVGDDDYSTIKNNSKEGIN